MTQVKSLLGIKCTFHFAIRILLFPFQISLINSLIKAHTPPPTHTHTKKNALCLTQAEIHVTFPKMTFPFMHF